MEEKRLKEIEYNMNDFDGYLKRATQDDFRAAVFECTTEIRRLRKILPLIEQVRATMAPPHAGEILYDEPTTEMPPG